MRRWLMHIASLLSALMLVLFVALWIRSHWVSDWVSIPRHFTAYTDVGRAVLIRYRDPTMSQWSHVKRPAVAVQPDHTGGRPWLQTTRPVAFFHATGFACMAYDIPGRPGLLLGAPLWFLTLASGVLPVTWFVLAPMRRRVLRRRRGQCPACGYDLRASPTKCPECGWAPGD